MLGWFMVSVYAAALFVYTFVPLPTDGAAWCAAHHVGHNFHPFQFVDDIRRETAGLTLTQTLESFVFLQVFFNIVLFIPFGAFMRRYFGRSILVSTLAGFATSVFIETSQYTGIFGIYPCSIRVGDVDDVITNTAGALLGALLAPAVLWWVTDARALSAKRLEPRPVTVWRRWTGMVLDALLFALTEVTVQLAFRVVHWMSAGEFSHDMPWEGVVASVMALLLVFVIPAAGGRGASAGQKIVWLTPKWTAADGTLTDSNAAMRILRSLIVAGPWAVSEYLPGPWGAIGGIVVFAALVMVPFTRSHRSLSGVLTGAQFVDSRSTVSHV
jgi:Glycopeptide antibiotics resistance protein